LRSCSTRRMLNSAGNNWKWSGARSAPFSNDSEPTHFQAKWAPVSREENALIK
jgi:hypothetical protein